MKIRAIGTRTISTCGCWILLLVLFPLVESLVLERRWQSFRYRKQPKQLYSGNPVDYEFIPPDNIAPTSGYEETDLKSSYPAETPAGLRGEAVRSALRSTRCIGWNLWESPLQFGLVQIDGDGVIDFLNNKLTSTFSSDSVGTSCLLSPKGRLTDIVQVGIIKSSRAYILSSPGHNVQDLFDILNKAVFKLDRVALTIPDVSCIFTLASVQQSNLQRCFQQFMAPKLGIDADTLLPTDTVLELELTNHEGGGRLCILPTLGLPPNAGCGCTFCFVNDGDNVGPSLWDYLVSDQCAKGPVAVGALEYESLRIECGQSRFGYEIRRSGGDESSSEESSTSSSAPPSPLELNLQSLVDEDKGCYLGQEGIASVLKNPRGPPRRLYQVVFENQSNMYDNPSEKDVALSPTDNLTRLPRSRDSLFVLGSNEEIKVGELTSVSEPNSTGDPVTIALALVKRPDSILRSMATMDLELSTSDMDIVDKSGVIRPKDPLEGLEVIVEGTFTVGKLREIPSRLFVDDIPDFVQELPGDDEMNDVIEVASVKESEDDLLKAQKEAKEAEAEAQRKADKLALLKKRAEEAMARRKRRDA